MANSRRKGKEGELEFSKVCREEGFNVHRGVQYHGGPDSPDVTGLPKIHPEVKRVEKLNIDKAMEQARDEAGKGEIPVVFHRKNRKPWLVTMDVHDWFKLYRKWLKEEGDE